MSLNHFVDISLRTNVNPDWTLIKVKFRSDLPGRHAVDGFGQQCSMGPKSC